MISRIRIPSDEEVDSVPSIHPTGIEAVASYNWVVNAKGQHKRIIVPGSAFARPASHTFASFVGIHANEMGGEQDILLSGARPKTAGVAP